MTQPQRRVLEVLAQGGRLELQHLEKPRRAALEWAELHNAQSFTSRLSRSTLEALKRAGWVVAGEKRYRVLGWGWAEPYALSDAGRAALAGGEEGNA